MFNDTVFQLKILGKGKGKERGRRFVRKTLKLGSFFLKNNFENFNGQKNIRDETPNNY